jgi:hypothetical protein
MDHTEKNVKDHLHAAKDELKNAASGVADITKDKVNEVIGDVAASISSQADKIEEKVSKIEPEVK